MVMVVVMMMARGKCRSGDYEHQERCRKNSLHEKNLA